MTIEGKRVSASEATFPPFLMGEEFVLFLSRHTDGRRYVVAYGSQGAFRRTEGFVEQVYGELKTERGRIAEAAFEVELRSLLPR